MTEKEIDEYIAKKLEEIQKETECDDCILFIGKDGSGGAFVSIESEEALVAYIGQMMRAYGDMGENPFTRQTCLLRALTQSLLNEVKEKARSEGRSCEIPDIIQKETEDDPPVER